MPSAAECFAPTRARRGAHPRMPPHPAEQSLLMRRGLGLLAPGAKTSWGMGGRGARGGKGPGGGGGGKRPPPSRSQEAMPSAAECFAPTRARRGAHPRMPPHPAEQSLLMRRGLGLVHQGAKTSWVMVGAKHAAQSVTRGDAIHSRMLRPYACEAGSPSDLLTPSRGEAPGCARISCDGGPRDYALKSQPP